MERPEYLFRNSIHLVESNVMRLNGEFTDVIIKANDREFRAHKKILATNLKYFQLKFQENKEDVITMENVDGVDLEALISYAYTGEILLTDTNALGLLKMANYLNEDIIKQRCLDFWAKHPKDKDACRAYQLAKEIESISLENAAKQTILSCFDKCSQTAEYLEFDCESLKTILRDIKLDSVSQEKLFEGIMRWIVHDVKNRRGHINDLLSLIEITKLTGNFLIHYLYEVLEEASVDIDTDVIMFYHRKMLEPKDALIMRVVNVELQMQFYDYAEKKWCHLRKIIDYAKPDIYNRWAISYNKFYCLSHGNLAGVSEGYVKVFPISGKRETMLTAKSGLLSCSALCTCRRFLYVCGGKNSDHICSHQVLKYDSWTGTFATLTPMRSKRSSAAAIFYQDCLLVFGGHDGSAALNSVEKYDQHSKEWTGLESMIVKRTWPAVAVLGDKLYACGGYNEKSVEVYDSAAKSWQMVSSMNNVRADFHVIARQGKLLAVGGDNNNTIEVYDPKEDQWRIDHEMSQGLQTGFIIGCSMMTWKAMAYLTNLN